MYEIDMIENLVSDCPHKNCTYSTNNVYGMRKHFRARHPDDIIIIKKEGLLPQCVECGLFQMNVNSQKHLESEDCKRFTEIKKYRCIDPHHEAATNVKFNINGEEINTVKSFKYLGRILTDKDDDGEAIDQQLKKARMTRGRIGKIIKKKTNGSPKTMSVFYKVIIQSVLLYGSESWVISKHYHKKLQVFIEDVLSV